MKPVFKEEREFLGIAKKYEGLLWVDKRAYRGFDKDMQLIKFGRNLEKLPTDVSNLLTHKEFCNLYYKENTLSKVEGEKEKLGKYLKNTSYEEYVVSVSGGKDSTVCGEIVMNVMDSLGINYRILFGNTSNETHFTYRYVKESYGNKLEIANPKEGFYQWCERMKFVPTRFGRACCSVFKEGNIGEYLDEDKSILHLLGMRRDESKNRSLIIILDIRRGKKPHERRKLLNKTYNSSVTILSYLNTN